ncbi:hypothetical protein [Sphingomonas sp. LK11]|uniref:hypothetical protein n=1 Tax=Sphingomonas sp. LK11 TaxID=1390395 RepID=UPI0012EB19C7|nr:hypothetical protein [Sphingomonas sp. LK11]
MQVFVFTLLAVPALVGVIFTYLSCTAPQGVAVRGGLRILRRSDIGSIHGEAN